jgi:AcrR family transcriptional regulator
VLVRLSAVWNPIPLFPPVTTAVLPAWSGASAAVHLFLSMTTPPVVALGVSCGQNIEADTKCQTRLRVVWSRAMKVDPVPVRERTRRAVRAELAMLAQDLFAARGYGETTVDDIAAAAGMSRRTVFRYFASKEDLVLGKYELLGEGLVRALSARPPDEPIWVSLRRAFDVVVEYFDDDAHATRTVAMERIVQADPALTAGQLQRVSQTQDQLVGIVRERIGSEDTDDPRAPAIVGAALSCLIAAKTTWIVSNQARPFGDLLNEAMGAIKPTSRVRIGAVPERRRPRS